MTTFEKKTGRDKYFFQLKKELQELIDPQTGKLSLQYSKYVTCPVCDSEKNEEVFVKDGYTFVRCIQCGLIYSNPQVQEELLRQCYMSSKANDLWMDILLSETEQKWRTEYFKEALDLLKTSFPKFSRILDVGCGVGHFLEIAKKEGYSAEGLELNDKARKYCLEKNLRTHNLSLEKFKPKNTYDVISFFGILEHLNNPTKILCEAKNLISDGGGVIIIVPNVYSLVSLLLREKNTTFDGRNHLLYFSMYTIEYLLKKCGFKVIHKDTTLFGIDNINRYICFDDPYYSCRDKFPLGFPSNISQLFSQDRRKLEKWILDNNLGLRLRIIGKKI